MLLRPLRQLSVVDAGQDLQCVETGGYCFSIVSPPHVFEDAQRVKLEQAWFQLGHVRFLATLA